MLNNIVNTDISSNFIRSNSYTELQYNKNLVTNSIPKVDKIDVKSPELLNDEEAQEIMYDVQNTISENPLDALTVHSGLDLSRVMALLADD